MKLKPLALGLSLALAPLSASAAEQTVTLSVPGMTCASCPYIVESAISGVEGVQAVETSLESRTATVTFDDAATTVEAITGATLNAGYESSPIDGNSNS